jgi:acetylornithine deacetylase/succinyl-diaminopimelate desuccinylase-like protein
VQAFDRAFRGALGQAPAYGKMTAWSDAAHAAALFGIPTVLYGPGVAGAAHTAHEYVPVQHLVDCTKVLATFLSEALTAS